MMPTLTPAERVALQRAVSQCASRGGPGAVLWVVTVEVSYGTTQFSFDSDPPGVGGWVVPPPPGGGVGGYARMGEVLPFFYVVLETKSRIFGEMHGWGQRW